jgi:hypothetical protein
MKKFLLLAVLFAFSTVFGERLFSQDQKKKYVYEFSILSISSPLEGKIIDDKMMTKVGIYASATDVTTKRIKVTVNEMVDFMMLRAVLLSLGYECTDKNMIKTEIQ